MLKPDFTKYSLALIKDDEIIFSSNKSGLRPLIECMSKFSKSKDSYVLHDKIIGLAAARIIVNSQIIAIIFTSVCSKPTLDFLKKNKVDIHANDVVENILMANKSDICPMEKRALVMDDNSFFEEMNRRFLGC